jgi:hypothetical protein
METMNRILRATAFVLVLIPCPATAQNQAGGPPADWKAVVESRLPVFGHRNWIVVADSAFPEYATPGIETIVADADLPTVLKFVVGAVSSSGHVRATVFLDKELQFINESDYPGAQELEKQIVAPFAASQVSSLPHSEVLARLDDAGKTFRILFIKTTAKIPYTSVHIRLDCGYMSAEVERKIKTAMGEAGNQSAKEQSEAKVSLRVQLRGEHL